MDITWKKINPSGLNVPGRNICPSQEMTFEGPGPVEESAVVMFLKKFQSWQEKQDWMQSWKMTGKEKGFSSEGLADLVECLVTQRKEENKDELE